MEQKQIDVTCPCCKTRLTIDVRTSSVLRSAQPGEVDAAGRVRLDEDRWEAAAERVRGRPADAADRLEQGLTREREKEQRLDDLFDEASRKLRPGGEDDPAAP